MSSGDLWNFSIPSWTYEIPSDSTDGASNYVVGGATIDTVASKANTVADATVGFRPVLTVNSPITYRGNPELAPGITLVTDPAKLVPGTAISCEYTVTTKGALGTYANLGSAKKAPLPDYPTDMPDGKFYWICVGYTPGGYPKCFADRNIQSGISWATLAATPITTTAGQETTVSGHKCSLRIPNSIPDRHLDIANSKYGEWDAIFTLYNTNGITASNNVWNTKYAQSFTTAILATVDDLGTLSDGTYVIARGYQNGADGVYTDKEDGQAKYLSTLALPQVGFRPVFIYTEIDASSRGKIGTTLPAFYFKPGALIQPGQVLPCSYTVSSIGTLGKFSELGSPSTKDWILAEGEDTPDGRFNWICVGYTPSGNAKFVADRNIQTNISWNTLNTAGLCITTGSDIQIDSSYWKMRLPNTSAARFVSSSDYGEWDAIVSLMARGGITPSNPAIWNCENNRSWTLATIATIDDAGTAGTQDNCITRGVQDLSFNIADSQFTKQAYTSAATVSKNVGFRPVMWLEQAPASNGNPYRAFVRTADDLLFAYLNFF